MKRIYLDNAATTPIREEVKGAMLPYITKFFGNPSSLHGWGQDVRKSVENAREKVASLINAFPEEIYFTSGGTESNNFVLKGVYFALNKKGNHIITTSVEHHSIIEPLKFLEKQGVKVSYVKVDKYGRVDPDDIRKEITPKTILLSVMHANNEVGTIQPIEEISKIAKEHGIYFHTDAVQSPGYLSIDVRKLNIDLLTLSAHKFYGPKGIGALYISKGVKISPIIHGGQQERDRRAGTENVIGIIGIGKAAEYIQKEMRKETKRICSLRDKLIKGILKEVDDVYLNGHPSLRLANNVHFSVKYIEGEAMLLYLDKAGVACSTGSACSSSSLEPSHVLLAMGISEELAHSSIRFTLGKYTTNSDIDYVLKIFPPIVRRLRRMSPLFKTN